MSNIALQIESQNIAVIESESAVIFENLVYSSGNIGYNSSTGEITFFEEGRYFICWWIATQSSRSTIGATFALRTSQGVIRGASSPIKMGELSGIGIIEILSPPVTMSLVNSSGESFYLSSIVPYKASLAIIEDDISEPLGTLFNVKAGESVEAPVNLADTLTIASETLNVMLQQFSPPIVSIELPAEAPYPAAQATLGNMSGVTVSYEESLPFDTPDMSTGTITFDQSTGIFTLNEAGIYKVSWWVATASAQSGSYVSFAVRFNGEFIIGQTFAATPIGQVNGDLVYWFFEAGTTLELINNTIDTDVTLATTPYQAGMNVVRLGGLG